MCESKLGSSNQNFQDLAARFNLLCIKLLCKRVLCLELLSDVTGLVFVLWTSVMSINHSVFAQGTGLACSMQLPVGNTNAFWWNPAVFVPWLLQSGLGSCATVTCLSKKKEWSKTALSQVCHNWFLFFLALLPLIDSQDSSVFLLSFGKSCWFYKPQLLQSTFPFLKSTLSQGLLCTLLELLFPAIPHSSQHVLSYRKISFPLLNIPHLIVILYHRSIMSN